MTALRDPTLPCLDTYRIAEVSPEKRVSAAPEDAEEEQKDKVCKEYGRP